MTRQRPLGLGTHIFVTDANAAVRFYSEAFGAAELVRQRLPDGRVLFVELAVGPDKLLLSEEIAELNALAPLPWEARRSSCCSSSTTSTAPSHTPLKWAPLWRCR
jgi:uncharacterized glyoxalase superfamily protein PhnB